MIETIKDIGEYAIEEEGKSVDNPLNILVDSPANRNTKNVLFIVLEREGGGFSYRNVDIEEYSPKELQKYLYRKGSSNGPDITPTSMITTIESTFTKTKIVPWFKQYNTLGLDEDHNFLVKIGDCIRSNTKQILEDLKEHQSTENNIISLKIDNKYLCDFRIFQKILVDTAKKIIIRSMEKYQNLRIKCVQYAIKERRFMVLWIPINSTQSTNQVL